MSNNLTNTLHTVILLLTVVLMTWSCNTSPSDSDDRRSADYRLDGALVKDWNVDSYRAKATLLKDDSRLDSALIRIGNDTLEFIVNSYRLSKEPVAGILQGAHNIEIADSDVFADTFQTIVAGVFTVSVADPPNRINTGGTSVTVAWTGSLYVEGYVVATVPVDSAYIDQGYSAWVTSQVTGENIPPEAFRWSDGLNPDTGWYNIYVYAFTGSPDSTLSSGLLPVPMPGDLADNISEKSLEVRFGTVVVALRDSVHVVIQ